MKETRFIAQNKEKWQESENLLTESEKDPEKLSNLFTQVIDDLSYSRTYYPNRSVRVYLNRVAREYFSVIYAQRRDNKNTFKHFWSDELPHIVYQSRKSLLISLVVFVLSVAIGVFSSVKDPEFATAILGERYVDMTKANIEKGDPMAVSKEGHQVNMFLGITLNNLMVAFRTYVFGVFFSIGTLAILLANGVMVGCFQFFFIERGLLAESALTIWLHGTLEISSIILAGGAGLTLGSGLLFPGTYSRLQAFQLSAIRSLKLMLGITPIFILAAIIESFLTRYTEAPDIVRVSLILMSALFIVGYFVIYPWFKARQGFERPLAEAKLSSSVEEPVSLLRIKNNGEIIKDSFSFYKKHLKKLVSWIFVVTLLMTTAEFWAPERIFAFSFADVWSYFLDTVYYAMKTPELAYVLINSVATSLILYKVFALIRADADGLGHGRFRLMDVFRLLLIVFPGYWLIYYLEGWGTIIILISWVFILLICAIQHFERMMFIDGIARTWRLSSENPGQVFGLQLILLMLSFSFLIVISAPLLYVNTSILKWNFAETDEWSAVIVRFVETFLKLFAFNLVIPIFCSSVAYLYFSLQEVNTAENLKKSISLIGAKYSKRMRS